MSVLLKQRAWFGYAVSVLIGFGFMTAATPVLASDPISLSTSETAFDVTVQPGQSTSGYFFTFNQASDTPLSLTFRVQPWQLGEQIEDLELAEDDEVGNPARWVGLEIFVAGPKQDVDYVPVAATRAVGSTETPTVTLPPSGLAMVRYTVSPPADAALGSFYIMVRLEPVVALTPEVVGESAGEESGPRFVPAIGVLGFLNIISGTEAVESYDELLDIQRLTPLAALPGAGESVPQSSGRWANFFAHPPVGFVVTLENRGRYAFPTDGQLELVNVFGQVRQRVPLPRRYLFPNRERTFVVPVPQPLPGTSFTTHLPWVWWRMTYAGYYQARFVLQTPHTLGRETIVQMTEFSVIPWWSWIFPLLFGACFFILSVSPAVRSRLRRSWRVLRGK